MSGGARRAAFIGVGVTMAAVSMLFGALSALLLLLHGEADVWRKVPIPLILWGNTAVLLASSGLVESARRALHRGARQDFNRRWTAATFLGGVFLVGQLAAWYEVRAGGFHLRAGLGVLFFYMLTAAHALHVGAGLAALAYVDLQALKLQLGPEKRTLADVSALFWHYLAGLWVYLLLLLGLYR